MSRGAPNLRARRVEAALVSVGLLCLACHGRRSARPRPAAPAACAADSDCQVGGCLCGLCTSSCGAGDCGEARSCHASGSLTHELTCGRAASAPAGLCLQDCALDPQCPEGQRCVLGGCVPRATSGEAATNEPAPDAGPRLVAPVESVVRAPSVQREEQWLLEDFDYISIDERTMAAAMGCESDPPCMTLQEALRLSGCMNVQVGCGMLRVAVAAQRYWYRGAGSLPVGSWDDRYFATEPLECDQIEYSCWSCDEPPAAEEVPRLPRCRDTPIPWPEFRLPEPPPGCRCEALDDETALVSLDCFCSIYGCEASLATNASGFDCAQFTGNFYEACGADWLEDRGRDSIVKLGYDRSTGELRAAATAQGAAPVLLPCGSRRVVAGEQSSCTEAFSRRQVERALGAEPGSLRTCRCGLDGLTGCGAEGPLGGFD